LSEHRERLQTVEIREAVEGHAFRGAISVFWQPCPGVALSRFCKPYIALQMCFAKRFCKTCRHDLPFYDLIYGPIYEENACGLSI
jgi:hypothetical protein